MTHDDDGNLTVHFKDPPQHNGNRRTVFVALMMAMVLAIMASSAFVLSLVELRASRESSDFREQQALERDRQASIERAGLRSQIAGLTAELERIQAAADSALGEQACRSLAFARQNAVESAADVVALELLTEVVAQTFRAQQGRDLDFDKLMRLERESRQAIASERVANEQYRVALGDCH